MDFSEDKKVVSLIMNKVAFQLLANQRLPFYSRRVRIMHRYLRHKRWDQCSYCAAPIEVVIPCIESDAVMLPFVVKSIRQFLTQPIERICIVGPENTQLLHFCKEFNCSFIHEDTVLPIKISDVGYYSPKGSDRRGWLFQQLLKLGADSFVKTNHYYVLDADTVLASPQCLLRKNKVVLNVSDEFHQPYRIAYSRLLGEEPTSPISFVAHQMLFEKAKLVKLKEKIEKYTGLIWYEAILDRIDRRENSSFSEYETYGNFLIKHYLEDVQLEYFFNISLDRVLLKNIVEFEHQYGKAYKSLSFHWHTNSGSSNVGGL